MHTWYTYIWWFFDLVPVALTGNTYFYPHSYQFTTTRAMKNVKWSQCVLTGFQKTQQNLVSCAEMAGWSKPLCAAAALTYSGMIILNEVMMYDEMLRLEEQAQAQRLLALCSPLVGVLVGYLVRFSIRRCTNNTKTAQDVHEQVTEHTTRASSVCLWFASTFARVRVARIRVHEYLGTMMDSRNIPASACKS